MTQEPLFPNLAPAETDDNVHWYTPAYIMDAVRDVFHGRIALDPASCAEANRVVQADRYYSVERGEDGLSLPWSAKTLWLNPPFNDIQPWVDRVIERVNKGSVRYALVLTNNATETTWWQNLARRCEHLCFLDTRIKFWGPLERGSQPRQGQTLFYLQHSTRDWDTPSRSALILPSLGVVLAGKNTVLPDWSGR